MVVDVDLAKFFDRLNRDTRHDILIVRLCNRITDAGMIRLTRVHLSAGMPDIKFPDIWLNALVPLKRLDVPRIRILLQWLEHNLRLEQAWPALEAGAAVGAAAEPQG